jgi:dephospho-CoA kinase
MDSFRPILRVGLTGGIASGKTTVARILAEHGAFVIEADDVAHELLEPGTPVYASVLKRFGREILDASGCVVRSRLAARVFGSAEARKALNEIVHPAVRAEATRRIEAYAPGGRSPIAVLDAALLVETGAYRDYHKLIVCRCSHEAQIRRLIVRDGLTTDEVHARLAAQAPLEHKLRVADYVIDTEGTLRETRRQTDRVYSSLLTDFELEFGRSRR